MTDTNEPTFDITLEDASPREIAALFAGLGVLVRGSMQAAQLQPDQADQHEKTAGLASDLSERLTRENREAVRHLILGPAASPEMPVQLDEELLADLGVKQVDGEIVDAEGDDG